MGASAIPYLNGPCAALLTANAIFAALLAALAWRRRPAPGASAFCVAMCALSWWSATYAGELSSSQLATQLLWGRLSFLGVVSLPVAWLSFACAHTARPTALSPRAHVALSVIPLVTTIVIWTDGWHHLFYASVTPHHDGLVDAWVSVKGPWFWANMGYSYALLLAGSVLVASFALGLPAAHRAQSFAIMIGVAAPWIANVVHLTTSLVPGLDPTPFAFAVTGACLAWGLFRHRLLDVVPIAYRAVLEGLPDAVMVLGADGRLVEANPAAWRLLSAGPSDLIGKTPRQIITVRPGLAGVLTSPPPAREVQIQIDDELRDLEVETAPLTTAGGVRVGEALILHDITERKAVLRALAQSEKLYRDAIEASNGVPYQRSFDAEGFDHVGEGIRALLGVGPSRITPATLRGALLQPADPHGGAVLDPARALPWTSAGPTAPQSVDYQVRTATGETRWLADSFVLVHGEASPEPAGALGIITDVSARRQAEEALREALDRFEAVIETAPGVAIQGIDRGGTVMHWNRASATIYGFEAQEAIGRRIQDLVLADSDAARFEALLDQVWRTAEAPSPTEWNVNARDGQQRWVYSSMFPVMQGGAVVEVFCMDVDITDRRRLEETQRLAAVGQLAAGVAHEFNNLLAAIMMRAELTALEPSQEACQALTDLALRAARRGADTCHNLTAFARPRQPRRTAVSLEAAIDTALSLALPQLQGAQVEIRRDYASQDTCIYADVGQMEQVFLNLLINSCHAMVEQPAAASPRVLQVRTRLIDEEGSAPLAQACVSDTGTGISPEDMPRIFEPFYTTKGLAGTDEVSGSGLGLSVAHAMVAAHGGAIEVNSEVGVGTTLVLTFPALDDARAQATPAPAVSAPLAASHSPYSVLLAEDEDDLREVVADALERSGYQVTSVDSAGPAIEALRAGPFDLVITDMLMPEGGGRAVLAELPRLGARPPVLVITGRADDALLAELAAAPGRLCLSKPFGIADVLRAVELLLSDAR